MPTSPPPPTEASVVLSVRFSPDLLDQIDELVIALSRPGQLYTRGRLIRLALAEHLPRMAERERKAGRGRNRRT